MKNKANVHETLSLIFRRDGVPPKMMIYGSKEQTLASFRNKYQEADLYIKKREPY